MSLIVYYYNSFQSWTTSREKLFMWQTNIRDFIGRYSASVCHLCGLSMNKPLNRTIWCQHCLSFFSSKPRCQQCGLVTHSVIDKCGACLADPPLWDRLYCVGDYQPPLSNYIHNLKYQSQTQYTYDLSYLLSKQIIDPAPLFVSMPLHWRRFIQRGYNQSVLLGYYLERHLQSNRATHVKHLTKFDSQLFKRIKSTPKQQGLNKQQRVKNLKGAFSLKYIPDQTHIAIIDDVVTTGSSVRQLCKLLLDVGVKKIDIYCICRTGI